MGDDRNLRMQMAQGGPLRKSGPPLPHHYDQGKRPVMFGPKLNHAGLPIADERKGSEEHQDQR
jgi:hypothetical protein